MTGVDSTYDSPLGWTVQQLQRVAGTGVRRAVVLTASERLAHALRRHVCVELGAPELLAGVSLMRPASFAAELLVASGRARLGGWEAIRRLRLYSLFLSEALDRQLSYFKAEQLRSSFGYAEAFAATIQDLECSGLTEATALQLSEAWDESDSRAADRLHDVAIVWRRVDTGREPRATAPQLLNEAATVVRGQPEIARSFGPVIAVLTNSPSTALLRLLDALADCHVMLQEARPWRTGAQRWRSNLMLAEPGEARAAPLTELGIVKRYLYQEPEVLTDPARPRSSGADDTIAIEQYASIEEEVEAAANWAGERVSAGVPLEEIALITPEPATYAAALLDRLSRLTGERSHKDAPSLAAHVAGGLALSTTPAGLRLLAVLDAVRQSLDAAAVIRLLPMLRKPGQSSEMPPLRLSPSRAAAIVYGAGILGGTPRDPTGVREWVPRLEQQRVRMREMLQQAETALSTPNADKLELRREQMAKQQAGQWLNDVEPLLPAIAALQQLGEAVAARASLSQLWPQFAQFCEQHLVLPPFPPTALALLRQHVVGVLADVAAGEIRGAAAVHFLSAAIHSEALVEVRFGRPAIFIGTPAQAAGLRFEAVRVLGLAEGGVPRTPHDDPILPDDLRGRLEELAQTHSPDVVIPRQTDHVLDDVHDVFRTVQAATRHLTLSFPRQWTDRSERELSGVVLEVATALGRRARADEIGDVPTAGRLRVTHFHPDSQRSSAAAEAAKLTPRALLMATARALRRDPSCLRVPLAWERRAAVAIGRLRALGREATAPTIAALDGDLAAARGAVPLIGIGDRPVSASALGTLLSCPHRFLLERLLHYREPFRIPSTDSIDPVPYGQLLHGIVEKLFGELGPTICERRGDLEASVERGRALAHEMFEEFRRTYPLQGADSIARQAERLMNQVEQLVRDEWQRPPRQYVASELGFGQRNDLELPAGEAKLRIWGEIDRIDRLPDGLSVRDIKTGRIPDSDGSRLSTARDLQIGLYVLAVEASAAIHQGATVIEAAYVHPSAVHEPERPFRAAQLDSLRRHTERWLGVAGDLLRTGTFVRTSNSEDCRFCPFKPACGDQAAARSAEKLRQLPAIDPLARFWRMKEYEAGR